MQTRPLGPSNLRLTSIGFGSFALGGSGWRFSWGPQDDEETIKTMVRAVGLGINWIDTAPIYGLGHAEEVLGRALQQCRPRPLVATKCGRAWQADGMPFGRLKKASVKAEVEASLKRLRVEVIDLYQIHWPQPPADIEEGWAAIAEAIKAGKVRWAGVSNFNVEQMQRVQPVMPIASLQPPYSMLRREIEKDILPFCLQNRIGVIVYSPLAKGLLTDNFTSAKVAGLAGDDHRRNDPQFLEPALSANLKLVAGLRLLAADLGLTVSQLAIAWTLARPGVTAAIVGGRSPAQVEETVRAAEVKLSPDTLAAVEKLLDQREQRLARP